MIDSIVLYRVSREMILLYTFENLFSVCGIENDQLHLYSLYIRLR